MQSTLDSLCSHSTCLFRGSPASVNLSTEGLEALYRDFNGGYFWNRALLIRSVVADESAPLTLAHWNRSELWKGLYLGRCDDITFFAEDAFGIQFGVRRGCVVQFDPETAEVDELASSVEGWMLMVMKDPDCYTGAPVLAQWEDRGRTILPGCRLIPRQLFVLGGDYRADNMLCKPDVEGMRIRAGFWQILKDLPDGQSIVFRVEE